MKESRKIIKEEKIIQNLNKRHFTKTFKQKYKTDILIFLRLFIPVLFNSPRSAMLLKPSV